MPYIDTFKLKDGSVVTDSRLDRIEHFDERSRAFSIFNIFHRRHRNKQRSYTWRCLKHLDQGKEGSCSGHALSHLLIARPNEVLQLTHVDAVDFYHEAQRIDPWPGGSYEGAIPKYEGTSILAIMKIGKRLGYYKSYHWAFNLQQLITGIGYKGPAVLGIPVYEGMTNTDQYGYIHVSGNKLGGHAILCKGVNLRERCFILHNSWSERWGVRGDCKISFVDMERILHEHGEAVFVDSKVKV